MSCLKCVIVNPTSKAIVINYVKCGDAQVINNYEIIPGNSQINKWLYEGSLTSAQLNFLDVSCTQFPPIVSVTPTVTSSPTPTPTTSFGGITIALAGEFSEGSIGAYFVATANRILDSEVDISFTNTLGRISGPPVIINSSVTILAGQSSGNTYLSIDDDYNTLNGVSTFSNIVSTYTGTTSLRIQTDTEFDVTPTPTTTVTQTPTPTNSAASTPTPTVSETAIPTPTPTVSETALVTPTPTNTPTNACPTCTEYNLFNTTGTFYTVTWEVQFCSGGTGNVDVNSYTSVDVCLTQPPILIVGDPQWAIASILGCCDNVTPTPTETPATTATPTVTPSTSEVPVSPTPTSTPTVTPTSTEGTTPTPTPTATCVLDECYEIALVEITGETMVQLTFCNSTGTFDRTLTASTYPDTVTVGPADFCFEKDSLVVLSGSTPVSVVYDTDCCGTPVTPTPTSSEVIVTPTPTSTPTSTEVPVTPTSTPTSTEVPVTPTPTSTCGYGGCYHYAEVTLSGSTIIQFDLCGTPFGNIEILSATTYPSTVLVGPFLQDDCLSGDSYTVLSGSTPVSVNYFNPCCEPLVTPTPTETPGVTASETPTPTPTETPGVTASETPTPTVSETPTSTPTVTPTSTTTDLGSFTVTNYHPSLSVQSLTYGANFVPTYDSGSFPLLPSETAYNNSTNFSPALGWQGTSCQVSIIMGGSGSGYMSVVFDGCIVLSYPITSLSNVGVSFTPTCSGSPLPIQVSTDVEIIFSVSDDPFITPTPTGTPVETPTPTVSESATSTPTPTISETPTNTPTPTITPTPTNAILASCVNVLSYKQFGSGFSVNDPGYMQLPTGTPFSSATIEYRFNNIDSNGTNAWNIFGNLLSGDTILVESNDFGYNYISYQVVTPPVWNGLHWVIDQVSVLDTNTNSRAVFTISSNVTFTINSLCPTPTPTGTPAETPTPTETPAVTPSETPTNTPTPSITPTIPVGFGYDLVVLPYNLPSSGNSIMNNEPSVVTGSTNPNVLDTNGRGFYFNSLDNTGTDRTDYFTGFTGQSITISLNQGSSEVIYSGDTDSFKQWVYSGGTGFVFGTGIGVPPSGSPSGSAVLIQSGETWQIGLPVYVNITINTPTPTPTESLTPTPTVSETPTETPTNTPTPTITPTPPLDGWVFQYSEDVSVSDPLCTLPGQTAFFSLNTFVSTYDPNIDSENKSFVFNMIDGNGTDYTDEFQDKVNNQGLIRIYQGSNEVIFDSNGAYLIDSGRFYIQFTSPAVLQQLSPISSNFIGGESIFIDFNPSITPTPTVSETATSTPTPTGTPAETPTNTPTPTITPSQTCEEFDLVNQRWVNSSSISLTCPNVGSNKWRRNDVNAGSITNLNITTEPITQQFVKNYQPFFASLTVGDVIRIQNYPNPSTGWADFEITASPTFYPFGGVPQYCFPVTLKTNNGWDEQIGDNFPSGTTINFFNSVDVQYTTYNTCIPTPTPTGTPAETPTNTPTPSTSPVPVTGYGYNLVVLPYNAPTSGNTIFPTFATPVLNSGTTNPNTFDINGVYWNSIDNTSIDRTSYYSGMTGVSVTAYFTQNGNTAIYSGSTTAFTFDGPPGQQSFNYNPNIVPDQLVLIQSASTNFATGQTVYISYTVNG
jgi:hypothetical protein